MIGSSPIEVVYRMALKQRCLDVEMPYFRTSSLRRDFRCYSVHAAHIEMMLTKLVHQKRIVKVRGRNIARLTQSRKGHIGEGYFSRALYAMDA